MLDLDGCLRPAEACNKRWGGKQSNHTGIRQDSGIRTGGGARAGHQPNRNLWRGEKDHALAGLQICTSGMGVARLAANLRDDYGICRLPQSPWREEASSRQDPPMPKRFHRRGPAWELASVLESAFPTP